MIKTYNNDLFIICKSESTRAGFNHIASIFYKNKIINTIKAHYKNRTWESYQFESVIRACDDWIDNNIKLEHFIKQA